MQPKTKKGDHAMTKTEIRDVAPLPFTAFENCEGWTIAGPNNEHVAYCDYGSEAENSYSEEATAAFIVRACNAHREMVAALELCADVLGELARLDDGTPSISALHLARAALDKVKPRG
jgi:hypothetical protein